MEKLVLRVDTTIWLGGVGTVLRSIQKCSHICFRLIGTIPYFRRQGLCGGGAKITVPLRTFGQRLFQ